MTLLACYITIVLGFAPALTEGLPVERNGQGLSATWGNNKRPVHQVERIDHDEYSVLLSQTPVLLKLLRLDCTGIKLLWIPIEKIPSVAAFRRLAWSLGLNHNTNKNDYMPDQQENGACQERKQDHDLRHKQL